MDIFITKKNRCHEKDKFNFCSFIFTTLNAREAPDFINYKDVVRDANGTILSNKSISFSIVISVGANKISFSF